MRNTALVAIIVGSVWSAAAFRTAPLPPPLRRQHSSNDGIGRMRQSFTAKTRATIDARQRPVQPSALLASPSGIDELPVLFQTSIFFGIYVLLGISTSQAIKAIDSISKSVIGLEKWRDQFIDTSLPLLLGLVFLAAGVGHFLAFEAFCDIYPPIGTWGIWYFPGTSAFHVTWTGIVEILGGGGLLLGGLQSVLGLGDDDDEDSWILKLIKPASAATLFLLTIVVTPANIYMYTHGALMGDMPPLDVSFHYTRFIVQVLLLSQLFVLAKDSFFFAWGDELD